MLRIGCVAATPVAVSAGARGGGDEEFFFCMFFFPVCRIVISLQRVYNMRGVADCGKDG